MKLSVPGVDVTQANPQQLVFDSKWAGTASIHQTGVASIGQTVFFTALSYIPAAIVSVFSGNQVVEAFWTQNNPETTRWAPEYETKVASGAPYIITSNYIQFTPPPSGFPQHYSTVRYAILRVPGI